MSFKKNFNGCFFQEQTWQMLSKSLNSVIEVTTQQTKMATGHLMKINIVADNGHAAW